MLPAAEWPKLGSPAIKRLIRAARNKDKCPRFKRDFTLTLYELKSIN